jgi:hypothetical protein
MKKLEIGSETISDILRDFYALNSLEKPQIIVEMEPKNLDFKPCNISKTEFRIFLAHNFIRNIHSKFYTVINSDENNLNNIPKILLHKQGQINCTESVRKVPVNLCLSCDDDHNNLDSFDSKIQKWFFEAANVVAREANVDLNVENKDSELCKKLGESYLKFQMLSMKLRNRMVFENGKILNQNATTGTFVQYTYARLYGIKKYVKGLGWDVDLKSVSLEPLNSTPKALNLVFMLKEYTLVLKKSLVEPTVLLDYLTRLSKLISSLYYILRIKGEVFKVQVARWALFDACLEILDCSLEIFDIEPIKEI